LLQLKISGRYSAAVVASDRGRLALASGVCDRVLFPPNFPVSASFAFFVPLFSGFEFAGPFGGFFVLLATFVSLIVWKDDKIFYKETF
jgi:hypothetical protein